MSVSIDGYRLFDETVTIEAESVRRESIERTAAGLDGVVSVDLGKRGREIQQKGTLRARSKIELNDRVAVITAFMDGQTHTLGTPEGETYADVRMDSLRVKNERAAGAGIATDYEIIYRQLTV